MADDAFIPIHTVSPFALQTCGFEAAGERQFFALRSRLRETFAQDYADYRRGFGA
jgi:hypothetical protein